MPRTLEDDRPEGLEWWVGQARRRSVIRSRLAEATGSRGLRFAFYGRISTGDFQDRVSSGRWQRDFASDLAAGHNEIVVEFFDVCSRRVAWSQRPEAARLLAALADPDRGFDAIVVGEFERAFCGRQLLDLIPVFERYGVQLWLPELDGPVDFGDPTHHALLMLLGVHSRREVQRARYRVTAAMRAQAVEQGRHLGGRPPYGYRLVDAGPHPNAAHARWGRRLHQLEPDPATAGHVRWIFSRRLAGHSVASIARSLNEMGVPCPSSVDPDRNRHRSGEAWTLRTVAAILANPRYTGRQVWNRQPTTGHTGGGATGLAGDVLARTDARRWSPATEWVISERPAHPALVSEQDFTAVQQVHTAPEPADGMTRTFRLTGLVLCQVCGRQLDAHWVHGRAGYRCRHGHTSANLPERRRAKNVYVREDQLLAFVTARIDQITTTVGEDAAGTGPDEIAAFLHAHHIVVTCGKGPWTLECETHTITEGAAQRPTRNKPQRIPRQRQSADEGSNHETSMRFVGK